VAATLTILDAGSYDQIRAAVDLALDAILLPDATIEQGGFAVAAEQEVLEREALVLPTAINAAEQALHRQQAAIYLAAARVAQVLPALTQQTLGDSRFSRTGFDPARRHASLRTLAERELALYLEPTKAVHIQQQFWLVKGRRGA
jgi:hypothetical protein